MSDKASGLLIGLTYTSKGGFGDMFCLHEQEKAVFCAGLAFIHPIAVLLCVLIIRLPFLRSSRSVCEPSNLYLC